MKNTILILITLMSISCKAQDYPLATSPIDVPIGSYIHDYNNELDTYTGTWIGNYNGNQTTLFITKEIKHFFNFAPTFSFYSDALIIKYTVKNSNGTILQNTMGTKTLNNNIFSMSNDSATNEASLQYDGTNCGVGKGRIFIKKLNNSQLSWTYYPNDTTLTSVTCPGNPDLKIYLPETENLVFTKQ